MLSDLVITSYQVIIRKLTNDELVGKRDQLAINFVLLVPNKLLSIVSVRCSSRVRNKEMRRAAASIPWLPKHKSPAAKAGSYYEKTSQADEGVFPS